MIRLHRMLLVCFCLSATTVYSQQFKYSCELDSVKKAGFYKIIITPELSAHLKTDLSDLRISDENKWVPHIIKSSLPYFQQQLFTEFPIIKNEITDSGKSLIIIENKKPQGITDLSLVIKNTSANRYASLSGSDDNTHWYIIDENIFLAKSFESKEDYHMQWISFPLSRYKFFKLRINNNGTDPLNVVKAGYYIRMDYRGLNSYVLNPAPQIQQKDSIDGRSYTRIISKAAYHTDRLHIDISGPKYFSRNAALFLPANNSSENKMQSTPLATFNITSGTEKVIDFGRVKSKTFFLVIDNKDNPPVKVDSVYTEQLQNIVIAWLEPGNKYSLLFDDENALKPEYDIERFRDSIPEKIDELHLGNLTQTKITAVNIPAEKKGWWIWPAIIGSILVLGLFTWKLNSDMKKSGV